MNDFYQVEECSWWKKVKKWPGLIAWNCYSRIKPRVSRVSFSVIAICKLAQRCCLAAVSGESFSVETPPPPSCFPIRREPNQDQRQTMPPCTPVATWTFWGRGWCVWHWALRSNFVSSAILRDVIYPGGSIVSFSCYFCRPNIACVLRTFDWSLIGFNCCHLVLIVVIWWTPNWPQ